MFKSLMNEFNNLTNIFKVILMGLALVFVGVLVHDFSTKSSLDTYITQYNAYKKDTVAKVLQFNDSITIEANKNAVLAQQAIARATKAESLAQRQKELADSLDRNRPRQSDMKSLQKEIALMRDSVGVIYDGTTAGIIIAKQDTLIQKKNSDISNLIQQIAAKNSEIILKDSQIASLKTAYTEKDLAYNKVILANDSLKLALIHMPKAPQNPDKFFGLIPKPSRTVAAIGGTILGIIGTVYILKR